MQQISSIGFIGGGRITRLLLMALKQKEILPENVLVSDPSEDMRSAIGAIDKAHIRCFEQNVDVLDAELLFLAVHPPVVKEIAAEVHGKIKSETIVVSLVPVISMEKLSAMCGVRKWIRMIPNAPSIIGSGYNPVVYSDEINPDEKQKVKNLFSNWGELPEVREDKLEAYAIISAMGPTYFWFQWLKLQALGTQFGMTEAEVTEAMYAMLSGSAETLYKSGLSPEEVLDLIPVCPLKDDESVILDAFDKRLTGLFNKLTQK